MIDRRLFAELKNVRLYWPKTTMAALAIVVFSLLFNLQLAALLDLIIRRAGQGVPILSENASVLTQGTLGLLLWAIMRAGATAWADNDARRTALRLKKNIRQRLVDRFLQLGPVRLKSERMAVLCTVYQEGVDTIEPYYAEFIPQLVLTGLTLPLVLMVVFVHDWLSALLMLITAPLIPLFMVLIGKLSSAVSARQWRELKRLNGHFLDVLRGLKTLHLFGQAERQIGIVGSASDSFRKTTLGVLRVSFLSALTLELTATISTALIAVSLGVRLLYGQLDFHSAFLILLLAPEYYQPLRQFGAKFHTAMGAKTATDAIQEWLEPVAVVPLESPGVQPNDRTISIDTSATPSALTLHQVSFAYLPGKPVLNGLNLDIPAGQQIALTGPSGTGKSTLAALLLGFLRPDQGEVHVANQPIHVFDERSLGRQMAYLPQYSRLFPDTIFNNLKLGAPDLQVDTALHLLDELGLGAWIASLPLGLETKVGQGGQPISGGQAQRLGLARVLLQNTPILILDEPTSALDPETEFYINQTLAHYRPGKTILTIAHRLSTIQQSDRLICLEHGQIVFDGSPTTYLSTLEVAR
ncbi:MAG: thiol reductant ABC exporter subunit CydD [Eubacteriales bacterium]|nr:thiol reductant ABC exporter subunit CydD [Eubacteriales bacterium]